MNFDLECEAYVVDVEVEAFGANEWFTTTRRNHYYDMGWCGICEKAGVPVQYFVNHSDVAGGSTLGNILTSQIPLRGVDMGAAIWAMHTVRETASAADHSYIVQAFTAFFDC